MKPKVIIVLVIAILVLIVLFQNQHPVKMNIYFWDLSLPVIVQSLLLLAIGFVCGFIVAKVKKKQPVVKA